MTIEERIKKIELSASFQAQFNIELCKTHHNLAKAVMKMRQVQVSMLKMVPVIAPIPDDLKADFQKLVATAETADEHIEAAAAKVDAALKVFDSLFRNPNPPSGSAT